MATSKTFSVKNGLSVANTVVLDDSRNLSNIAIANVDELHVSSYGPVVNANGYWLGVTPNVVTTSNSAPSPALPGSLWWDTDISTMFVYYDDGSSAQWVEANPQVLVEGPAGTYTLNGSLITTGDVTVQGTLFETSDQRLKNNIETIQDAVDIIDQLRGVNFNWKETNKQSVGLIAQEVESVLPFLIKEDTKGYKSINYTAIIGLLIEAVKELNEKIENGN